MGFTEGLFSEILMAGYVRGYARGKRKGMRVGMREVSARVSARVCARVSYKLREARVRFFISKAGTAFICMFIGLVLYEYALYAFIVCTRISSVRTSRLYRKPDSNLQNDFFPTVDFFYSAST